ncbi:MAG: TonB-dependent receptor [Rhodothalassiaceae bacterium]
MTSSQTITVITKDLIEDQGARDAQDLYRNISGVSLFSYAGVTARGFRQEEIFYDGLRGNPFSAFAVPQLFNVDRLEFLKGPAGMLYGPGAPGGLFNYITKKPTATTQGRAGLIGGTNDRYGGFGEISGPISDGLRVRGGAFYENQSQLRFNTNNEVLILDGGISGDIGIGTLTLQGTRFEQNLGGNRIRAVPVDNDGRFLADRRWNANEASDFLDTRAEVAQLGFDGRPSDNLSLNARLRHTTNLELQNYHEPRTLFDSDGDGRVDRVTRQFRDQRRETESWSAGVNAVWSNRLGAVNTRLLIGGDWFLADEEFAGAVLNGNTSFAAGRPTPLRLINPDYGVTDRSSYVLPPRDIFLTRTQRHGVYALGEATIGPVILTAGLRRDWFDDREDDAGDVVRFEAARTTWRAGAVWRVREDVSLYGQYATSFEPQAISAQDPRAGGPFAPTQGDIIEGGVKTALMNGRVQTTLAAYRIRRTNILQRDPRGDVAGDGIDDSIAFGEVTSKGIEFDIATDITPDWVLTLAYAYNDTRITGDNGTGGISNRVGDRFVNAPEHTLGFWTRYQLRPIGLAVAFGGDYVSQRVNFLGQAVPAYMIFDSTITYQPGPWGIQLRVQNIFDRTYAASGFSPGNFPGQPRFAFVELTRRF